MGEVSYLNKLLPGFQTMGFSDQLNALLKAANVSAVRANTPALIAKLTADGVTVTLNADVADLVPAWNAFCDALNAHASITLKDYQNCKVATVLDFGTKWNQVCVGLDREALLDRNYAALLGYLVVPFSFQ